MFLEINFSPCQSTVLLSVILSQHMMEEVTLPLGVAKTCNISNINWF